MSKSRIRIACGSRSVDLTAGPQESSLGWMRVHDLGSSTACFAMDAAAASKLAKAASLVAKVLKRREARREAKRKAVTA